MGTDLNEDQKKITTYLFPHLQSSLTIAGIFAALFCPGRMLGTTDVGGPWFAGLDHWETPPLLWP
jgi:hypothetical protein